MDRHRRSEESDEATTSSDQESCRLKPWEADQRCSTSTAEHGRTARPAALDTPADQQMPDASEPSAYNAKRYSCAASVKSTVLPAFDLNEEFVISYDSAMTPPRYVVGDACCDVPSRFTNRKHLTAKHLGRVDQARWCDEPRNESLNTFAFKTINHGLMATNKAPYLLKPKPVQAEDVPIVDGAIDRKLVEFENNWLPEVEVNLRRIKRVESVARRPPIRSDSSSSARPGQLARRPSKRLHATRFFYGYEGRLESLCGSSYGGKRTATAFENDERSDDSDDGLSVFDAPFVSEFQNMENYKEYQRWIMANRRFVLPLDPAEVKNFVHHRAPTSLPPNRDPNRLSERQRSENEVQRFIFRVLTFHGSASQGNIPISCTHPEAVIEFCDRFQPEAATLHNAVRKKDLGIAKPMSRDSGSVSANDSMSMNAGEWSVLEDVVWTHICNIRGIHPCPPESPMVSRPGSEDSQRSTVVCELERKKSRPRKLSEAALNFIRALLSKRPSSTTSTPHKHIATLGVAGSVSAPAVSDMHAVMPEGRLTPVPSLIIGSDANANTSRFNTESLRSVPLNHHHSRRKFRKRIDSSYAHGTARPDKGALMSGALR